MNIFVTVGTGLWDPLIQKLDELVAAGTIKDKIVAQIGKGKHEPKNFRFYRFGTMETQYKGYEWADLVIGTGGAGTIMELMRLKKKYIAVNIGSGSQELPKHMAKMAHMLYCEDLKNICEYIERARIMKFVGAEPSKTEMEEIMSLFEEQPWPERYAEIMVMIEEYIKELHENGVHRTTIKALLVDAIERALGE